jgi:hypothetical protein
MNVLLAGLFSLNDNASLMLSRSEKNGALWLGNSDAIIDSKFLIQNDIKVVINCTPHLPFIYETNQPIKGLTDLETIRLPVHDSLLDKDIYLMENYYHDILPFTLNKLINEKKNVIINCRAGRQRSASIVALVLFMIADMTHLIETHLPRKESKSELMRSVIKYILKKRPQSFSCGLRINFKRSLENFLGFKF